MIDFWAALLFLVVAFLAALLAVYNYRQAREIRSLRELVGRAIVMQERARREAKAKEIAFDRDAALAWLSKTVAGMPLTEVTQVYPDLRAVEVTGPDGRALITATPPEIVRRAFKVQKAKGAAGRLATFARSPFLSPGKVQAAGQGEGMEWFDLEAAAVGAALGVEWGEPVKLWALLAK